MAKVSDISLNLAKISLDSMRFRQIQSKSHQVYLICCRYPKFGNFNQNMEIFCRNLEFFARIWKMFGQTLKIFVGKSQYVGWFKFFVFWERKTETNLAESIFGANDPLPTAEMIELAGCRIRSGWFLQVGLVLRWVGQPYSPSPFSIISCIR